MKIIAVALLVLAGLAAPAFAGLPPGDDPPDGNDSNRNHVRELKPWKARFEYKVVRESRAYHELNSRSGTAATILKGMWWRIDCQMVNTTQNGQILFNHIPNVGWVADRNMRTYTDGRIPGSPTCEIPGPNHVWFGQPWAAAKEYRFKRNAKGRTRPAGAPNDRSYAKDTWTTIECSAHANGKTWIRLYIQRRVGASWVNADALKFWQKGLPAGLPDCGPSLPAPRRWVAMGDSYAAGQGANEYTAESGGCRRSNNAYWSLLKFRTKSPLQTEVSDFVACSGAETEDVLEDQLGPLNRDTGLVTISVGGNDLGFAAVLRNCVKPLGTTCRESVASHFEPTDLRRLEDDLDDVYRAIRDRAPNAMVLVLGYPELVPRDHIDGCGAMDDNDAPALHRAATLLNNVIEGTVGERPKFRFIGLVRTFLGHSACNEDAVDWIHGVVPSDRDESFHPTEAGQRAIAARLVQAASKRFE